VSLLHNQTPRVIIAAASALSQIARWWEGAQAIIDGKALNDITEMLGSTDDGVSFHLCKMLAHLAKHVGIIPASVELGIFLRLVALVR